jgi:Fe-S cluster assembly iron-binding protein IscA
MPATKCTAPPVITRSGVAIRTYSDAVQGAGFNVESPNAQLSCGQSFS